jgi:hypothetical protein
MGIGAKYLNIENNLFATLLKRTLRKKTVISLYAFLFDEKLVVAFLSN